MRLHMPRIAARVHAWARERYIGNRWPDFIVGKDAEGGPYLLRWYVTPWRRWREQAEANPTAWRRAKASLARVLPNLYVHMFLRDDDDRALHDHPSWACSLILDGGYIEHTIADGGIHRRCFYRAGSLRFMGTRHAHRIELNGPMEYVPEHDEDGHVVSVIGRRLPGRVPVVTLFLFGPTVREWGFHCPFAGWVHWREFTAPGRPGEVGGGCD